MLKNTSTIKTISVIFCLILSACGSGDMRETLGLNRQGPDEFQVYSRPPLNIPPEFNLRPPAGASEGSSASMIPAPDKAHNAIIGASANNTPGFTAPAANTTIAPTAVSPVSASELPTNADSQFLANVGADKANPNIRQTLLDDKLNGTAPKNSSYLLGTDKTDESVVDPTKEADRIKQDKAQDKPITTGDTPVIVPKDNGIFGNIF